MSTYIFIRTFIHIYAYLPTYIHIPHKSTYLYIHLPLYPITQPLPGDCADEDTGFSPFPGNINCLVFDMAAYRCVLDSTGGRVPEFVNPKYADAHKIRCVLSLFPLLFLSLSVAHSLTRSLSRSLTLSLSRTALASALALRLLALTLCLV